MSLLREVNVHKDTDIGHDAWGRNKAIIDRSQFSGLFTYDVPPKMWKEMKYNGVDDYIEQQGFTNATSVKGQLKLTSGLVTNDRFQLRSLDHVRYQANRGHLYSTAMFFPNPTARGTRKWGLLLPCNGVYFQLEGNGISYTFYLVIKNHFVENKIDITNKVPVGFDFAKGNLYDLQMQWRGVGDFIVYLNQEEIYRTSELGNRDEVSIENPSLPVGFECINDGDPVEMFCGCVDITSEGGREISAKYTSISTGLTLPSVGAGDTALLAIRMPYKLLYGGDGVCYSRDAILSRISTFTKDEAITAVYAQRGVYMNQVTGLPSITWTQKVGGFIEYAVGGNGSALDTAYQVDKASMNLVKSIRQERDFLVELNNPDPQINPFILNADLYILVAIDPDASTTAGCTIEMAEQL